MAANFMKTTIILLILAFTSRVFAQGTYGPVTPLSPEIIDPANGYTYLLLSQGNWTDSEAVAETLGGQLATINNQAEEDWIYNTFYDYDDQSRDLWIGLNDVAQPNQFVWTSGTPVTYTDWAPGEPDNGGESDPYVAIMVFPIATTWENWPDAAYDPDLRPFDGVVEIVPEPSIMTFFITGLITFALFARNRRDVYTAKSRASILK